MNTVYIIQELPGTKIGTPKFNIMGAQKFGTLKTLLNYVFKLMKKNRQSFI